MKKHEQKSDGIYELSFFDFDGEDARHLVLVIFFYISTIVNYYQASSQTLLWVAAENLREKNFPYYIEMLQLLQSRGLPPQAIPEVLCMASLLATYSVWADFLSLRKGKVKKWRIENSMKKIKKG